MEEEKVAITRKLIEVVNEIAAISDFRSVVKKQYFTLARRLKLLTPMFEEIRDSKEAVPEASLNALVSLKAALDSAKNLLKFGGEGSKIFLVLERDQILNNFHEVTTQLEQALSEISFENLDLSDEVKEQVELVLSQFKRAKVKADTPDDDIYEDLLSLYNSSETSIDPALLRRLVDKLQLAGINDLTQESLALHEMVTSTGGDPEETIEKMSMLLKKIKDFVQTENVNINSSSAIEKSSSLGETSTEESGKTTPVIPDDFRCPISLELMNDPVIVSTGQTYERSCIEKWIEAGHTSCPKTQQPLTHNILTPNYVLRSLITQWCESNGIEPPKRPGTSRSRQNKSSSSPVEDCKIGTLISKLRSGNPEDQRTAAGEIRLLAKRNADNRIAIAEAGAIPLLVNLLSKPDSRTQEHAVTALLNLSICEDNKGVIISANAVPGIVYVLKKAGMEARENAAATLFSLSVVDENKIIIGASGAIPPLVALLNEGSQRGKKDAATALFNLCIYQGNKGKAVRAGVVSILMQLLTEPQGSMVDEALAILAILASHPEGKLAIGSAKAMPVLVSFVASGSPRNKENAAAVLGHLCSADQNVVIAQELGVMEPLLDLAQNGTERGRRKAAQLLEKINRYVEQQKQASQVTKDQTTDNQTQPDTSVDC
ncbi:unnamed protein product [Cuscuta epithymum]|uniref:U-box domain-containing protein 12 n=2 Tax=Cuscuta epithymum TaxID=186058 RepID=A0AAV0DX28_9ASTE|nr:unnamed protein product [Cuscuta epithymum]